MPKNLLEALRGSQLAAHSTRISNAGLTSEQLPARIKLLNWGSNPTHGPDGKPGRALIVDDSTLGLLPLAQNAYGFDKVALDFAHNSVPGHANYQKDPRKVAGYGVPEIVKGEGLFLAAIEWTPSGKEFAREYADLSPTPLVDKDGRVQFLHSCALCPQGKVQGLSFFSAEFLAPATATADPAAGTLSPMTVSPELQKLLCGLFGAAENATEAELLTAGQAFTQRLAGAGDKSSLEAMSVRLTAIEKGMETPLREAAIAAAVAEGKVVPQSVRALPLESMKAVIADLPKGQVPVDRQTPGKVQPHSVEAPAGVSAEIRASLGISEETWNKHNPPEPAVVV